MKPQDPRLRQKRLDAIAAVKAAEAKARLEREGDDDSGWVCKCGKPNAQKLDQCWYCQRSRPRQGALKPAPVRLPKPTEKWPLMGPHEDENWTGGGKARGLKMSGLVRPFDMKRRPARVNRSVK